VWTDKSETVAGRSLAPTAVASPYLQGRFSYTGVYMPTLSAEVAEETAADLEAVAELLGDDDETTIEKALQEGLETLRIRVAVERYQTGDVSIGEAADIADCTVADWLEVAHEKNLTAQYTPEQLTEDAATAIDP